MKSFSKARNIALLTPRMTADPFSPLVTDKIISNKTASRYDQTYFFPLYIEPREDELPQEIRLNVDPSLFERMQKLAKLKKGTDAEPQHVFDYIYGVLHSPDYRRTYAEFLSIDFPRIPWPTSPEEFWDISKKGGELRRLHLADPAAIGLASYQLKGEGDNVVRQVEFSDGKLWINEEQYFDGVPEISWELYVGGYQPCQKWFKDRKSLQLTFDDLKQYQGIIKILFETDRIMKTIQISL